MACNIPRCTVKTSFVNESAHIISPGTVKAISSSMPIRIKTTENSASRLLLAGRGSQESLDLVEQLIPVYSLESKDTQDNLSFDAAGPNPPPNDYSLSTHSQASEKMDLGLRQIEHININTNQRGCGVTPQCNSRASTSLEQRAYIVAEQREDASTQCFEGSCEGNKNHRDPEEDIRTDNEACFMTETTTVKHEHLQTTYSKTVRFSDPLVTLIRTRPRTRPEDVGLLFFDQDELEILEEDRETTSRDQFEMIAQELSENRIRISIAYQNRWRQKKSSWSVGSSTTASDEWQ